VPKGKFRFMLHDGAITPATNPSGCGSSLSASFRNLDSFERGMVKLSGIGILAGRHYSILLK
jgi:ABC-type iron transport system FetAB ATPase subunit